jgi:hypothetical protein|tara:strand:- start:378 stop:572 length:195 start_codon:yes stop_codon:yes gene_type:complete
MAEFFQIKRKPLPPYRSPVLAFESIWEETNEVETYRSKDDLNNVLTRKKHRLVFKVNPEWRGNI